MWQQKMPAMRCLGKRVFARGCGLDVPAFLLWPSVNYQQDRTTHSKEMRGFVHEQGFHCSLPVTFV